MSQITCQCKEKLLSHFITHLSKRSRHKDVVLLHRELYLYLNRCILHGRALTNIGLWSRVHKIPAGVRQKAECTGKPCSFEDRIGNRNSCFETCRISNIGHILGRLTSVCAGRIALKVCIAYGASFAQLLAKKLTESGQVTEL